jgi:hypothetical protein
MKHGPSLQEERDALLEHIHASRAAYRRMLTEVNAVEEEKFQNEAARLAPEQPGFPRSRTMRWIIKHPYLSALAVAGTAALVVIGPRRAVKAIGNRAAAAMRRATTAVPMMPAMPMMTPAAPTAATKGGAVLGLLTALATAALRNPARIQMAMRTASSVAQFVRRRRQRHY